MHTFQGRHRVAMLKSVSEVFLPVAASLQSFLKLMRIRPCAVAYYTTAQTDFGDC